MGPDGQHMIGWPDGTSDITQYDADEHGWELISDN
jgi:hypothetical protein